MQQSVGGAHRSSESPASAGSAWPQSGVTSALWWTQTRTTDPAPAPSNLLLPHPSSAGLLPQHSPAPATSLLQGQL